MKIDISKSLNKNIDRSKWKKYYFSDFAENIVEKIVPKKSGLEHYIGLEHLDAGSLKIRRFGETKSLIGDKLKIYKGDLIFAKRNAYLKRVAVAEFDAVASAHSMVLRPKSEIVLPEFLPFFMLSDKFWNKAIEISVGSLSPTINWKALAKQEFLLPPKQDQTKLAKLLWAADNVVEKDKELLEKLEALKFRTLKFIFTDGYGSQKLKPFGKFKIPENWDIKTIENVANIEYGISESVANNTNSSIGWPILTGANITLKGELDISKLVYIQEPKNEKFYLNIGDLLFNWRSGSPEHIGKTAMFSLEGNYTYASFILRIRCFKDFNTFYAYYLLNHLREIEYFTKDVAQQVNFKMNASIFRQVKIPIPDTETQINIVNKIKKINDQIVLSQSKLQASQALLKSLINEVFV